MAHGLIDFIGGTLGIGLAAANHRDARAIRRQPDRNGMPDAASASRNDCDLAGKGKSFGGVHKMQCSRGENMFSPASHAGHKRRFLLTQRGGLLRAVPICL